MPNWRVRLIAERYGQHYNCGTLWGQFSTILRRIWIYRLPAAGMA
jgi:linoleoyl-CoA desaturase